MPIGTILQFQRPVMGLRDLPGKHEPDPAVGAVLNSSVQDITDKLITLGGCSFVELTVHWTALALM